MTITMVSSVSALRALVDHMIIIHHIIIITVISSCHLNFSTSPLSPIVSYPPPPLGTSTPVCVQLCTCVVLYICIYVRMYICNHTYVHMYIHIYTCIHT